MRRISCAPFHWCFRFGAILPVVVACHMTGVAEDSDPARASADVPVAGDRGVDDRAAAGSGGEDAAPPGFDEFFAAGRELWEQYAPEEIKAEHSFPSIEDVRGFLAALETDLAEGDSQQLAAYEPDARRALELLRQFEGGDILADWLEPRMDLLTAAVQIEEKPPVAPPIVEHLPQFTRDYWDRVLAQRQPPRRAADFVPRLKVIFNEAGVPSEWVWIAEVESAMNPEATSPVGARGLFQFMPVTALRFGLKPGTEEAEDVIDERTDPEKSARAAAAYLRILHRRFQSWPLALAAYNAGEGRVGRALAAANVTTFEDVADRLPVETRMYVPKVLATVALRESVDPLALPAPRSVEPARATASVASPVPVTDGEVR